MMIDVEKHRRQQLGLLDSCGRRRLGYQGALTAVFTSVTTH